MIGEREAVGSLCPDETEGGESNRPLSHPPHVARSPMRPAGCINQSVEHFIIDSFGEEKWHQILEKSGVSYPWVSSCPYADKVTYE